MSAARFQHLQSFFLRRSRQAWITWLVLQVSMICGGAWWAAYGATDELTRINCIESPFFDDPPLKEPVARFTDPEIHEDGLPGVPPGVAGGPGGAAKLGFMHVELLVDTGTTPLAAYQVRIKPKRAAIRFVGVEGGDHDAFRTPPYYDPRALRQGDLILAAFSTNPAPLLPTGLRRLAALHIHVADGLPPEFDLELITAADPDEKTFKPIITIGKGN